MLTHKHIRGSAMVELALLTPALMTLVLIFFQLGWLFVRQIHLERLAIFLARDLAAAAPNEPEIFADQWLRARRLTPIHAQVSFRVIPTLPRPFPQPSSPVTVVSLDLERPLSAGLILRAHAREVVW